MRGPRASLAGGSPTGRGTGSAAGGLFVGVSGTDGYDVEDMVDPCIDGGMGYVGFAERGACASLFSGVFCINRVSVPYAEVRYTFVYWGRSALELPIA